MTGQHDQAESDIHYQRALEFIGEVKAGISWERFCMKVVANFEACIEFLRDSEGSRAFLSRRSIERSYVMQNLRTILEKAYFNSGDDHYLTLGLHRDSTAKQIHDRWKSLMVLYHPDRNRIHDSHARSCASRINEAYSVLKDTVKRREYDRRLARTEQQASRTSVPAARARMQHDPESMPAAKPRILSVRARKVLGVILLPAWIVLCLFLLLALLTKN